MTDAGQGVRHAISKGVYPMKTMQRISLNAVIVLMALGLGACSGMSRQGQNTAVGAGAGALGGAILTGGSAVGTVGGAVVGGVIGHEVTK
jgi:osmotically inducible lipoprotein OsmB